MTNKKIAIFASGNGTNTENICHYFKGSTRLDVVLVCTNNPDAFVLKRIKKYNVPSFVFSKLDMNNSDLLEKRLASDEVDFIILAGFLLKIPKKIINVFNDKIINVHPSILPKYGGKGMYGDRVHEAVVKDKSEESGITIHLVDEEYDNGAIINQKIVAVDPFGGVDSVRDEIQRHEHIFWIETLNKIQKKEIDLDKLGV